LGDFSNKEHLPLQYYLNAIKLFAS